MESSWIDISKIVIALGVIGGAIYGICVLLWKISAWKTGVDNNQTSLQDNADEDRTAIKGFMKEIRDDIKKIFERLPIPTTATGSPIKLTELGEEISSNLEADQWAKAKAPELINELEGNQPYQPYEIQVSCFSYADSDTNYEGAMLNAMKMCAFRKGIDLDQVKRVFGVELRDAILKRLGLQLLD